MLDQARAMYHRGMARFYERLAHDRIARRRYHDSKARSMGYPRPRASR
jgi:hypothetical protein